MKSLLRLVSLVLDDQLARGEIKDTDHGSFASLPRRLDPQVASALGPSASEIGMGKGLRLVAKQQSDIASLGLLLQQTQAQAGAIDRIGILSPLQRVARPAPAETPFLRITTLSRDFEIRRNGGGKVIHGSGGIVPL